MISVLVVDDSVVVRRLIVDALGTVPGIRIVGTASNGRLALSKIDQLSPDLVTMDIEMPEMDGLTALRELRKRHRRLPVIMFSTLTEAGASATLDALAAGASDYVTKPTHMSSLSAAQAMVRDQLVPRIQALAGGPVHRVAPARTAPPPAAAVPRPTGPVAALLIGASTGGPDALAKVIGALPGNLPVPVLVVQHMPPVFTAMFAERLNRLSSLSVVEAQDGMPVAPGRVFIAPGDHHLQLVQRGTGLHTKLNDGPPENSCRPAVDVLFRSAAGIYRGNALAAILTGMGQDGKRGAEELHAAGAEIVAQDEASSVVWGMPGAVVTAHLAHTVLPLGEIAQHLISRIAAGKAGRPKVVVP
ncbi:MAG TPA: chemotaxis response regulator protein-glutamate methylesterase [Rugosimonospora sp.]|nr:chemotaxis response regulator protein-glutamate methylesterase [Rugosimonospora sp.]